MVTASQIKQRQEAAFKERQSKRTPEFKKAREAQFRVPGGQESRGGKVKRRSGTRKVEFNDPVSGRLVRAKIKKGADFDQRREELIRSVARREIALKEARGEKVSAELKARFSEKTREQRGPIPLARGGQQTIEKLSPTRKPISRDTPEQLALALKAGQQFQRGSSKFEALRARRLAEQKRKITKETQVKRVIETGRGKVTVEGTVSPFKPRVIKGIGKGTKEKELIDIVPKKEISASPNKIGGFFKDVGRETSEPFIKSFKEITSSKINILPSPKKGISGFFQSVASIGVQVGKQSPTAVSTGRTVLAFSTIGLLAPPILTSPAILIGAIETARFTTTGRVSTPRRIAKTSIQVFAFEGLARIPQGIKKAVKFVKEAKFEKTLRTLEKQDIVGGSDFSSKQFVRFGKKTTIKSTPTTLTDTPIRNIELIRKGITPVSRTGKPFISEVQTQLPLSRSSGSISKIPRKIRDLTPTPQTKFPKSIIERTSIVQSPGASVIKLKRTTEFIDVTFFKAVKSTAKKPFSKPQKIFIERRIDLPSPLQISSSTNLPTVIKPTVRQPKLQDFTKGLGTRPIQFSRLPLTSRTLSSILTSLGRSKKGRVAVSTFIQQTQKKSILQPPTTTISRSSFFPREETLFRTGILTGFEKRQEFRQQAFQDQSQDQRLRLITDFREVSKEKNIIEQTSSIRSVEPSTQRSVSIPKIEQKNRQKLFPEQDIDLIPPIISPPKEIARTDLDIIITPKKEGELFTPKTILPTKELEGKDKLLRKAQGFNSFAREKGKRIKLNKNPMTRNRAINLVLSVLDNTPSATGFVNKGKKITRRPDVPIDPILFKFKQTENKFTEKNTFRIDSKGELQGITVKGLLAQRKTVLSFL